MGCRCVDGFVFTGPEGDTVAPCPDCRPEQYVRWQRGTYAPVVDAPRHVDPLEGVASLRDVLVRAGDRFAQRADLA